MTQRKKAAPAIHPTAIVHPDAELAPSVTVGAYSVIGAGVRLGEACEVMNHVTLEGPTVMGARNRIFAYASIGQDPQDKKFNPGEPSFLEIGDDNVVREFVTINRGTEHGGQVTRIGHRNWLMAYCHVAHDCQIGNDTVFANCATLGGHVTIGDRAYLGGFTAVHQFCSVGELVMTGGHTMIGQDVPPFVIATGNRVQLYGVNRIGLERAGVPAEEIKAVERAYRRFFRSKLRAVEALAAIESELADSSYAMRFVAFIRASTRGICR